MPQRRKRFILVGSLNGKASDFEPTIDKLKPIYLTEKGIKDTTTIGDAISDLLSSNGTTKTPATEKISTPDFMENQIQSSKI